MLKFASLPRERNDLNLHLHLEMRKVSPLRQLPEMVENKLDFLREFFIRLGPHKIQGGVVVY